MNEIEITIDLGNGIRQTIETKMPCGMNENEFCRRYIRKNYCNQYKGKTLRFSWWDKYEGHAFGSVYVTEPAF